MDASRAFFFDFVRRFLLEELPPAALSFKCICICMIPRIAFGRAEPDLLEDTAADPDAAKCPALDPSAFRNGIAIAARPVSWPAAEGMEPWGTDDIDMRPDGLPPETAAEAPRAEPRFEACN